jgi:hypothetical protein
MLHLGLLNLILFWSLLLVSIALFSRHSILISLQPPPPRSSTGTATCIPYVRISSAILAVLNSGLTNSVCDLDPRMEYQ